MNDPNKYQPAPARTDSYDWNEFSSAVPAAGAVSARTLSAEQAAMMPPAAVSHPPSTRRVQFYEARVVGVVAPISSMSQQERDELWYTPCALDNFKTQVRSMCRKLRQCPKQQQLQQEQQQQEEEKPSSPTTSNRGLEQRVCPKRQRNKQLALRCVLKAQMRSSCPDFLATISSKCTSWARQLAENEGSRDYAEAYAAEHNNKNNSNHTDRNVASVVEEKRVCKMKQKSCPILSKLKLCPAKRTCDRRECGKMEEDQRHVRRKEF